MMDQFTISPGEALANADLACHIAKEKGRNRVHVYKPEQDQRKAMDLELGWSTRLHDALEKDLFELVFHPIVAIRDLPELGGAAVPSEPDAERYEVLLRLKGIEGEIIMPEAFLPSAERFNLMPQIDRWVLRRAFQTMAEQASSGRPRQLSINLSAHTIADRRLSTEIKQLIRRYGVRPQDVCFEITETSAITNLDAARGLIHELHELGCHFALDDFGSGFCSFGHLKNLAVDFIKIDGLFTQGVVSDPIDRAVVLSIVEIAHALGIKTVAEFVENVEILTHLAECGVDYVQGHYISEPRPLPGVLAARA
jgi:EAL domain-containing protein (putative c-di-GMP-specific phosphodiesterase class I)